MRKIRPSRISIIEQLECRALLSASTVSALVSVIPDSDPADVITAATQIGSINSGIDTHILGTIDQSGIDVDWYRFTLPQASSVQFILTSGVVSLYNNAAPDLKDQLNHVGHRLLSQAIPGDSGPSEFQRDLAAGTYFVAVSGSGNRYFNPILAGSGIAGQTGDYVLEIASESLTLDPALAPMILAADVTPLVARLNLSHGLGFAPTIRLVDATGASVPTKWTNSNSTTFELQIAPARPWSTGDYQVVLLNPDGQIQLILPFEISTDSLGEQGLLGNDTPDTSIELGNIGDLGLVQVQGYIGDDPFYETFGASPITAGNDADLYHFSISSSDPVALLVDVFAGRIGSPLDAGVSLYRLDATTGHLIFLAGNNNTSNATRSTIGSAPLFHDSAFATGLSTGDYYISVSSGFNAVSPLEFQDLDSGLARSNPELAHSGASGWSLGQYILNLKVISNPPPLEIIDISIEDHSRLDVPPTEFTVQFSTFANLANLAATAFQSTQQSTLAGVYIQNQQGHKFFPRLTEFDSNLTAHFLMLDRIPAGRYTLHLDGSQDLTNLIGSPLVGNSPSGDYEVDFVVTSAAGGLGNTLVWNHSGEADSVENPQSIGPIFPHELQAGVTIQRTWSRGNEMPDTDDFYEFEIIQSQSYTFQLMSQSLPASVAFEILDAAGNVVAKSIPGAPRPALSHLSPGTYSLHVSGWPSDLPRGAGYEIYVRMVGNADNAPPLYSGPAPAVWIRLATAIEQDKSQVGSQNPPTVISPPNFNGGMPSSNLPGFRPQATRSTLNASIDPSSMESVGSLRSLLPGNSGNFVIAIPALSTPMSSGLGTIRKANRLSTQEGSLRRDLVSTGLSDLADGLVGNDDSIRQEVIPSLRSLTSLRNLIESEISDKNQKMLAEEEQPNPSEKDEADPATESNDTEDSSDLTAENSDFQSDSFLRTQFLAHLNSDLSQKVKSLEAQFHQYDSDTSNPRNDSSRDDTLQTTATVDPETDTSEHVSSFEFDLSINSFLAGGVTIFVIAAVSQNNRALASESQRVGRERHMVPRKTD